MKILLVANTDWYLYHFRLSLASYLRERGDEIVLVSPGGPFVRRIHEAGFRTIGWNVSRSGMNPLVELANLLKLAQIYRQEKPDLVHHFTMKPVLYGTIAASLTGVASVINTITGLGYLFLDDKAAVRLTRRLVIQLYRILFRRRNLHVIFENDDDRQYFIRLGAVSLENSSTVPGVGVDLERFRYVPEPEGTPLIVFPSRMLLDKGLGVLVEAVEKIHTQHAFRVALVGPVDPGNPATVSEETIREWERRGLVEYWGFRQDMEAVFQQSHIVTLPSFGEGLPTSLIEAAASGRPVVATDVPGCRDVVTDRVNGLLVPPQNAGALAEALVRLINDPELRSEMGKAGRRIAEERFADAKINGEILGVYQKTAGDYLSASSIF